ncbi:Putative Zn-dependent protease [Idiomarina sp. A28L]|uniref:beta-barrel assembly-enhancing protease n=1 Tax=Idiomarina sp. A28L TaxID=1036674 RepID=UPI0002138AC2|nr:M48 family metalloprotease [Idiomarina sp. A28L]EGN75057.1 Putative Zn-dependent protease [Idiomarina sp. A28L]
MLRILGSTIGTLAVTASFAFAIGASSIHTANAQSRTEVPTIGTAGGAFMSVERERLYGEHYLREIRRIAPIVEDPVLKEYLNSVGNRLVRHADNVQYPFHFFWVRDDSINAFAFLGGNVGMHTGLLLEASDESEMAAVLAHEIAHVTQRHIARNMERMTAAAPLTIAQMLGGIVVGLINPTLGMAVLSTGIAGAQQRQINYTRQFEREADRVGMAALARAGYDPEGAPRFFTKLQSRYRYATQIPQFLITHPLPESRIADTRSRAQILGALQLEPALDFELARSRVLVRYTSRASRDLLLDFERNERIANHTHKRQAAQYGRALALFALEQFDEANDIIDALIAIEPFNLFYLDTKTDILLGLERSDDAVEWLTREYMRRPNNQVVTLNLAYAGINAGEYSLVRSILNDYISHNKTDIVAYQMLIEMHQKAGNSVAMHEAQAELHTLRGNFQMGVEELHSAYAKTSENDESNRQRIQARIFQLRALEAERNRVFDI